MKYIIWGLIAIVILCGAVLIRNYHPDGTVQTAAATPLTNKRFTQGTTVVPVVSNDTLALDAFIAQIPTITTKLQSISKDPASFKANLQKAQEAGRAPYINIAALYGYWAIVGTFTTSGGETCGNVMVPANNQIVTEAGPGTCLVWGWVLYPWWLP